jgi:hypothetical protein
MIWHGPPHNQGLLGYGSGVNVGHLGNPIKAASSYGIAPRKLEQDYPIFFGWEPKHLNNGAAAFSLLMPWLMFSYMLHVVSFSTHYERHGFCRAAAICSFCVVVAFGFLALVTLRKRYLGIPDPLRWYPFIFATSLLAWSAALGLGSRNYSRHMQPYYDSVSQKFYPGIDPQRAVGQEFLDMGRGTFITSSYLDIMKSMAFKDGDIYCVAPVVSGPTGNMSIYDFWAVGINCCSGHAADFSCGDYDKPNAHSAVRVMRDDLLPKFRLAVKQAESAYRISARTPIFVHWTQDSSAGLSALQGAGYQFYVFWVLLFLGVQLFLVLMMRMAFRPVNYI